MTAEISYLTDARGNRNSVIVPLNLFVDNSFEELYDFIVAENRLKNDEFVEFQ